MKTLCILAGMTIAWAVAAIWPDFIRWVFSDQPATDPDCHPRFSTWHNGERTEGAW